MTLKRIIVEKAKSGGYRFNSEYVLGNYHVKQAIGVDAFHDAIREAVISYARWQLDIIKGGYGYVDRVKEGLISNVREQLLAYDAFDQDWQVACELEQLEEIEALGKGEIVNE